MSNDATDRARTQGESAADGAKAPPMRAEHHSNASPAVETPVEARQGYLGAPVLMVLIGGLVLAVLAWFLVEMVA